MGSDYALNPPPDPPLDAQVRAIMDHNRYLSERVATLEQEKKNLTQTVEQQNDTIAQMAIDLQQYRPKRKSNK